MLTENEVKAGDLILAITDVNLCIFAPVEVLEVGKKESVDAVRVGEDVWRPLYEYTDIKNGSEKILEVVSFGINRTEALLKMYKEKKAEIEETIKDIKKGVPKECLKNGHNLKEIYRGDGKQPIEKNTFKIMKCNRCEKQIVKNL